MSKDIFYIKDEKENSESNGHDSSFSQNENEHINSPDIVPLAERYGAKFTESGHELKSRCVLHDEKTPSFFVDPQKNVFYCFGCGESGDTFDLVMKKEKTDYKGALRILGLDNQQSETGVYEYYNKRRISKATVDHFKISQKGNAIVTPYLVDGKVINNKYKSLKDKKFWCDKGKPKPWFNNDVIKESSIVFITEGELDCISLHEVGFTNAISVPFGVNSRLNIRPLDDKKIVIAGDNDEPGLKLTKKLIELFGFERCSIVMWPSGCKDANEVLMKYGKDKLVEFLSNPFPATPNSVIKKAENKINRGTEKLRNFIINQFLREGIRPTKEELTDLAAENDVNIDDAESISKSVFRDMAEEFGFNTFHIFKKAKYYLSKKWEIRRNIVSEQIEIRENGTKEFHQVNVDTLYCYLNEDKFLKIKKADVKSILDSDFIIQYDPIHAYFESLEYDPSEDFINKLSGHIKVQCTDEQLFWQTQFKKALVRMVAQGLGRDVNRIIMVLQGQKQETGKTTFIRFLCPLKLKAYYTESPISGNAKDVSIRLSENFMYNMEELEGMHKKEVSAAKAMLSTEKIKERRAYGIYETTRQRRASFWASTNPKDMLQDTENTRWLIFEVKTISWAYSTTIDIDKVWAQAYHLYKTGFDYHLTKDESQKQSDANEAYGIVKSEEELIALYFKKPDNPDLGVFYTATEICHELNRIYEKTRLNPAYIGRAIKKVLGMDSSVEKKNGKTIRGYSLISELPIAVTVSKEDLCNPFSSS